MAPQAAFGDTICYPSLATMAAAYTYGIAKNHGFHNANKRVSLSSAIRFLSMNGKEIEIVDKAEWIDHICRAVADPDFDRAELVAAFAAEMPGGDVAIE